MASGKPGAVPFGTVAATQVGFFLKGMYVPARMLTLRRRKGQGVRNEGHMRRGLKIVMGFALVAGLVLVGAAWIVFGAPAFVISPAKTLPPKGFNATDYPTLASIASRDRARVLDIGKYGDPFEHHFIPDISVSWFTVFADSGQERMVFLAGDGSELGHITDRMEMSVVGTTVVTPEARYELTADSLSERIPLDDIGVLSPSALTRVVGQSTRYLTLPVRREDPDQATNRIHVMKHEGVWKRASSPDETYHEWKVEPLHNLEAIYRIDRSGHSGPQSNFFNGRCRVELTHFDQREFLPERGAAIGSTTGVGRVAHWSGTGYYTVLVDNAPMLRFRIDDDQEYVSEGGPSTLVVEGNAALNFIALIHSRQDNRREEFVIKGC